jgi:hypothetical protein
MTELLQIHWDDINKLVEVARTPSYQSSCSATVINAPSKELASYATTCLACVLQETNAVCKLDWTNTTDENLGEIITTSALAIYDAFEDLLPTRSINTFAHLEQGTASEYLLRTIAFVTSMSNHALIVDNCFPQSILAILSRLEQQILTIVTEVPNSTLIVAGSQKLMPIWTRPALHNAHQILIIE